MFLVLLDTADNHVTINTDHVVSIRPGISGETTTTLHLVTGGSIKVKQDYEHVIALLSANN
jgi:hypothetical protein